MLLYKSVILSYYDLVIHEYFTRSDSFTSLLCCFNIILVMLLVLLPCVMVLFIMFPVLSCLLLRPSIMLLPPSICSCVILYAAASSCAPRVLLAAS